MNWNKLIFIFFTTAMFGAAALFGAAYLQGNSTAGFLALCCAAFGAVTVYRYGEGEWP